MLESRSVQADSLLNRDVTVTFRQPSSLGRILQELRDQTGALLIINGPALAAAGRSPISQISLVVEKKPLALAMNELLRPFGLAFRVVDPRMVEITSAAAVKSRLELEIYHVTDLLIGKTTGETLLARITSEAAPTTWSDAGGGRHRVRQRLLLAPGPANSTSAARTRTALRRLAEEQAQRAEIVRFVPSRDYVLSVAQAFTPGDRWRTQQ